MKNKLMDISEKFLLRKIGIVESVFDILTTVCNFEHTRHRSPTTAIVNMFSAVSAYNFLDIKPSLKIANALKYNRLSPELTLG